MRQITKGAEPKSLVQYRARKGAVYDGAPSFTGVKVDIRAALLAEQGHLCAYCMSRILTSNLKIEHWHPQSRYPEEQLSYANMLACCPGNQGERFTNQHCGTRQGSQDIRYNPAEPRHHARLRIQYSSDGAIRSEDTGFNEDLDRVLNLNLPRLKRNRAGVLDAVRDALSRKHGCRTVRELQALIRRWERPDAAGQFNEYCDVAVHALRRKLRQFR